MTSQAATGGSHRAFAEETADVLPFPLRPRGAEPGANQARPGFFGAADGGTLLLDEVEALPLSAQATLLRAVDHGEIQTVGSAMIRRVDVRIIACTNVDLALEAAAGRFRKDLYYRLAVATISLPALRYRPEDIEPLVRYFAADFASRFGTHPVVIPSSAVHALQARSWPGNVRELENAVACMVALSDDGVLRVREPSRGDLRAESGFRAQVAEFERILLLDALARCGTHSAPARGLGLSRTTFLDLLRRHGISGRTAARPADLSGDNIEVE